jgi:hypothetical protein
MRKTMAALLLMGLLAGGVLAETGRTGITFSLNGGAQTGIFPHGTSFHKAVFTLDGRVGFLLGGFFEISPEFMAVFSYRKLFDLPGGTLLYPGVMLNLCPGRFFVGAGAVLPWAFFAGQSDTGRLAPKVNIGYRFGRLLLTAYMIAWNERGIDFLDMNFAGITLGFGF